MKKNANISVNNSNVTINRSSLRALMGIVFQGEASKAVAAIAKDLTKSGRDEDILGLNLALVINGVEVEIDKTPRMSQPIKWDKDYKWEDSFHVYVFQSFSAITSEVCVMCYNMTYCTTNASEVQKRGKCCVRSNELQTISLESWEAMTDELDSAIGTAIDCYAVDGEAYKWYETEHTPKSESAE